MGGHWNWQLSSFYATSRGMPVMPLGNMALTGARALGPVYLSSQIQGVLQGLNPSPFSQTNPLSLPLSKIFQVSCCQKKCKHCWGTILEVEDDYLPAFYTVLFLWKRTCKLETSLWPLERGFISNCLRLKPYFLCWLLIEQAAICTARFEWCMFPYTHPSLLLEVRALHLWQDSQPVQGPVLQAVDCSTRVHVSVN